MYYCVSILLDEDADKLCREYYAEPLVMCKECIHRDPENKKCDCGGMPWDTQVLPVPDDWFCPKGRYKA